MSVMRCDRCDHFTDTDEDVEGLFEDAAPFRYWCSNCIEFGDSTAMFAALKKQEPDRYAEIFTDGAPAPLRSSPIISEVKDERGRREREAYAS